MNYYERHLGDYARDTAHLSMLEHGAYTLLLDRYYATEQPIPADQAHRVARARTRDERAAVDSVLSEFFILGAGAYVNARAEHEIEQARARIDAARENGKKGGRPRKNPTLSVGFQSGSEKETQPKAHQAPSTSPTPSDLGDPGLTAARSTDLEGVFEGHSEPFTPTNPAVPFAVVLNRAGFSVTAMNPDLVAYVADGGTVDHLAECAALPDCIGKRATYPIRIARRELADRAQPISTGPPRRTSPSKPHTGLSNILEGTRHDPSTRTDLVLDADPRGAGDALHAEPRRLPGG